MQVVPFQIEHFDRMDITPEINREQRPLFEAYTRVGPAITLLDGEMPIGISGILCGAWKGFGEIWMIPSIHVPKYPKASYATAVQFVNYNIEKLDLYRLQTTIRENDLKAIRWIERLGFQREGLMRCFGPDKGNHFIYARVKECLN